MTMKPDMPDRRAAARESWLQNILFEAYELQPLAGDASFRCYFRVISGGSVLC